MKRLCSLILLLFGVSASVLGAYAFLASDSLDQAGARHEASHAIVETHTENEALDILRSLDDAWRLSDQVALVLFATGVLLAGSSLVGLRRNIGKAIGSVS